jgi:uncharacterized protein YjiS (DUF1127 family)
MGLSRLDFFPKGSRLGYRLCRCRAFTRTRGDFTYLNIFHQDSPVCDGSSHSALNLPKHESSPAFSAWQQWSVISCAAPQHSYVGGNRNTPDQRTHIMKFLFDLQSRVARHAEYRRTVKELRSLPLDVALDLDIYPGDAKRIAAQAVYNN